MATYSDTREGTATLASATCIYPFRTICIRSAKSLDENSVLDLKAGIRTDGGVTKMESDSTVEGENKGHQRNESDEFALTLTLPKTITAFFYYTRVVLCVGC